MVTKTAVRPVRMCDSCGGVDDHPRHVMGLGPNEPTPTPPDVAKAALKVAGADHFDTILAQIRDEVTVVKHMDCCRSDGCPDRSCDVVTSGAEIHRGVKLLNHLLSRKGS